MLSTIEEHVLTYLKTAPTSNFLKQEVHVQQQWQGSENLLWRVQCSMQDAVLKLYLDAGQARSRRQFDGQQQFSPLGIAPRPLWYDRHPQGLARQVLVYEWMPGVDFNHTDPNQLLTLAQTIAQVHNGDIADVHRFSPNPVNLDYFWRILQGSIRSISEWLAANNAPEMLALFRLLAGNVQQLVEATLPMWQGVPPTPVHGDLKVENCITNFGTVILLDWELFGLGDPALEAANFLYTHQQVLDDDTQSHWLDHYLSLLDQPNLQQRIDLYSRILPFQSICFLLSGLQTLQPATSQQTEAEQHETRTFIKMALTSGLTQGSEKLNIHVDHSNLEKAVAQVMVRWEDREIGR
ncbi:MAG: aminoglycoside phosphotransferase family protein [Chloroflexota bacterium]